MATKGSNTSSSKKKGGSAGVGEGRNTGASGVRNIVRVLGIKTRHLQPVTKGSSRRRHGSKPDPKIGLSQNGYGNDSHGASKGISAFKNATEHLVTHSAKKCWHCGQ